MAAAEQRLMEWLRVAHAMEIRSETMLAFLADRIESYPDLKAELQLHLERTREQARRLRRCIERRGGDTSTLKDLAARFAAFGQGIGGFFADNEIVKATLAAYVFKHLEIGPYAILIAAVNDIDDRQTAVACIENDKEEDMAVWLRKRLPAVTMKYLDLEQMPGAEAKV